MPDKYLATIVNILTDMHNETVGVLTPEIWLAMINNLPALIACVVPCVMNALANWSMIGHIVWKKRTRNPPYSVLIRIAISNVTRGSIVFLTTVAELLEQNGIIGKFVPCALTIVQYMLIYASMKTFVLMSVDSCRSFSQPRRSWTSALNLAAGAWLLLACTVSALQIYIMYYEVMTTNSSLQFANGLFIVTCIAFLVTIAYVRVETLQNLLASNRTTTSSNEIRVATIESTRSRPGTSADSHTSNCNDVELDVHKETRTQKYLIYMVFAFAVLQCLLIVLKLVELAVVQTPENAVVFDVLSVMFCWLGHTSAVTTPIIYALWQTAGVNKKCLRGCYCCSKRQSARPDVDGIRMTEFRTLRQHPGLSNISLAQTMRLADQSMAHGPSNISLAQTMRLADQSMAHGPSNISLAQTMRLADQSMAHGPSNISLAQTMRLADQSMAHGPSNISLAQTMRLADQSMAHGPSNISLAQTMRLADHSMAHGPSNISLAQTMRLADQSMAHGPSINQGINLSCTGNAGSQHRMITAFRPGMTSSV